MPNYHHQLKLEGNSNEVEEGDAPLLIATWLESRDSFVDDESREWASIAADEIIQRAELIVDSRPEIPQQGGNWTHYFVCDDGSHLEYDSNRSDSFWCPSEQAWYTGEKYTSSWIAYRHEELISNGLDLAISFRLTNDSDFATAAEHFLIEYAELYPQLELRNKRNQSTGDVGRLTTQSLDEAVLMIDFAWMYDLISETIDEIDRSLIEDQLLRPGISTLQHEGNQKKDSRLNFYTWHNAAKMMVGVAVDEPSFIDEALNGSSGFVHQLTYSVLDDGLWYEGSLAYHNYSLHAMLYILEAGRSIGLDLYNFSVMSPESNQSRTIKQMFLSPIDMLRPDGAFPRMNDDIRGIKMYDMLRIYELANMVWNDSVFDWALQKAIQTGPRTGWSSLFWGRNVSSSAVEPESRYYSDSGIGILRTESGYLMLDYGPHGGWHGHEDKLTFELFSMGEERFIDAGVTYYSLPISSQYFRSTLGHSTLMVNGVNQLEAEGELVDFQSFSEGGMISAKVVNISTGVNATRTMILVELGSDGVLLIDILEAFSNVSKNYSSILHGVGDFSLDEDVLFEPVGNLTDSPWSYLSNCSRANLSDDLTFNWTLSDNSSVDVFIPFIPENRSIFLAEAPNNPPVDTHSMIMVNATANGSVSFPAIMHAKNGDSGYLMDYHYSENASQHQFQLNLSNGRNISIQFDGIQHSVLVDIEEFEEPPIIDENEDNPQENETVPPEENIVEDQSDHQTSNETGPVNESAIDEHESTNQTTPDDSNNISKENHASSSLVSGQLWVIMVILFVLGSICLLILLSRTNHQFNSLNEEE